VRTTESSTSGPWHGKRLLLKVLGLSICALCVGNNCMCPPCPQDSVPQLVQPLEGAELDNGCEDRSDGIVWDFDWTDVAGASEYHLYVNHTGSPLVNIDTQGITTSSYHFVDDTAYVIEANRFDWVWRVRAKVDGLWGPWSPERSFNVEPLNTDCAVTEFRDRDAFTAAAAPVRLINFDADPCGASISAPSPGVLANDLYQQIGVVFSSGVIFGESRLAFNGISRPNTISNSQINTPTPALVDGSFSPPVHAVGITNTGAEAVLRIFDENDHLIASLTSDADASTDDFLGLTSLTPIYRFQFDFVSGIGFEGDDLLITDTDPAINCP
jgi:hypothetical protein